MPPNFGSFATLDTISYPFYFLSLASLGTTHLLCGMREATAGCKDKGGGERVCFCKGNLCNDASTSIPTYLQLLVPLTVAAIVSGMNGRNGLKYLLFQRKTTAAHPVQLLARTKYENQTFSSTISEISLWDNDAYCFNSSRPYVSKLDSLLG